MLDKWWPYACLSACRWLCVPREEKAELGSFCRQFNIGDTVYVLCKNNNGTEGDINYLQIVWHMQGIVLAIITISLSVEDMHHATAILYHCVKAFRRHDFTDLFFGDPRQHRSQWIVFRHVLYHAHCLDKNKSIHSMRWGSWGSLFHFLSLWRGAQINPLSPIDTITQLQFISQVSEVIYGNVSFLFTKLSRMYGIENGPSQDIS